MFSIGEFSMMTGIPVRTLRFYHEQNLLVPAAIDSETNYRSYDLRNWEVANVIVALRELEFSLDDIRQILAECSNDADLLNHLQRQRVRLVQKAEQYRDFVGRIESVINHLRQTEGDAQMLSAQPAICERDVESVLIAGIRMTGRYSDCGQGFAILGKRLGRHIAGKPLCLFYDGEYREDDANVEPCMPIDQPVAVDGISSRELPLVRCATLLHHGAYDELKHSYARLLQYVKQRGYEVQLPTREVYIKGPGVIFRGNAKKYITEIQIPIATA